MSRELTFQTMQKNEVKFYADLFTFTEKTLKRILNFFEINTLNIALNLFKS